MLSIVVLFAGGRMKGIALHYTSIHCIEDSSIVWSKELHGQAPFWYKYQKGKTKEKRREQNKASLEFGTMAGKISGRSATSTPPLVFFHKFLKKSKILRQAALGATLYGVGEHCIHNDWSRSLASAVVGAVGYGPLSAAYYPLVDRWFRSGVSKIVFDQTAWSLLWNYMYCVVHRARLEDAVEMVVKGWLIWPFVHIVTFNVIPLAYRTSWVMSMDALWLIYMSTLTHSRTTSR